MWPLKKKESLYCAFILPSLLHKIGRTSLQSRRVNVIRNIIAFKSALITCCFWHHFKAVIRLLPLRQTVWSAPPFCFALRNCQNISSLFPGLLDRCPFFFPLPNLVNASWLIMKNKQWDLNQSESEKFFERSPFRIFFLKLWIAFAILTSLLKCQDK